MLCITFNIRFNELDANFRQRECEIEKLRTALLEQEKTHILAVGDLQSEKETMAAELLNLKTTLEEKEKEMAAEIKR